MTSRAEDILDSLPHRPPFRFVTEVVELKGGESAKGIWRVNGTEDFFTGHFPDRPVVPGVLLGEALAQLSGLVVVDRLCRTGVRPFVSGNSTVQGKLAHVDIRFNDTVFPPADILLESRFERMLGSLWQFDVVASAVPNSAVPNKVGSLSSPLAKEGSKKPNDLVGSSTRLEDRRVARGTLTLSIPDAVTPQSEPAR